MMRIAGVDRIEQRLRGVDLDRHHTDLLDRRADVATHGERDALAFLAGKGADLTVGCAGAVGIEDLVADPKPGAIGFGSSSSTPDTKILPSICVVYGADADITHAALREGIVHVAGRGRR